MVATTSNATLIANPTLDAHPYRYSAADGPRNPNRFAQQLRYYLRWRPINGQVLEIRGHDPRATGIIANFYDHDAVGSTIPTIPSRAYQFAEPMPDSGPSQQISLREIVGRFDISFLTQDLLSRQIPQIRFYLKNLKLNVITRLEDALINGDSSARPAEFDGLTRLVERGLGQQIDAGGNSSIDAITDAITAVRAHNRRINLIVMNQDAWRHTISSLRAQGVRPEFRRSRRLRQPVLFFDGVPVCLSDHIATTTANTTSVFLACRGRPNGLHAITSRKRRRIFVRRTRREDSPVISYTAHYYGAVVSPTSDALVEIANWRLG